MTFPLLDMGVPIPGTTNLGEPPVGPLPPPPPRVTNNNTRGEKQVENGSAAHQTPQHYARMLYHSLKVVTEQAETLNAKLRDMEENADKHAPLLVLMVHQAQT